MTHTISQHIINHQKPLPEHVEGARHAHHKLSIVHYPLLIAFCLLLSVNALAQGQYFDGGTGTSSNPYQIRTATHLSNIADYIADFDGWSNTYFIVTAHIKGTGNCATKIIGNSTTKFKGHFDGNNDTIELNITATSGGSGGGLFGQIENAVIENVIVIGSISYYTNGVGCIVGSATENSRIENCKNFALPGGNAGSQIAGVVGKCFSSTIIGCENYANISCKEKSSIAGILAYSANGCTIENCKNYGKVVGKEKVGGIVGESAATNVGTSIISCENNADSIIGSSSYVGGIVGYQQNGNQYNNFATIISFIGCKNNAAVKGSSYVGGILGYFQDKRNSSITEPLSTIADCTNTGNIIATISGYVGGIVGGIPSPYGYVIVDKCINNGNVIGTWDSESNTTKWMGGIVGDCGRPTLVRNSYNTGDIRNNGSPMGSWELKLGGLIGNLDQYAYLYNSYNIGQVRTNNGKGYQIGGIVGHCSGTIENCYNGDTVTNYSFHGGGIVGNLGTNGDIRYSYAKDSCGNPKEINLKGDGSGSLDASNCFFQHGGPTNNPLKNGSGDLLYVLKAWVESANNGGDTYLDWTNASSDSDNKGMPKFKICTPITTTISRVTSSHRNNLVEWTASPQNATCTYSVSWTSSAGNGNSSATSPFNHTGLTNDVSYCYRVVAIGSGDYCDVNEPSGQVCGTPNCTPLTAPTLNIQTTGDRTVTVGWETVSGSGVVSYKLYYGSNSSSMWEVTPNSNPYTVLRLTNGQIYNFKIKAVGDEEHCGEDNPFSTPIKQATPNCPQP